MSSLASTYHSASALIGPSLLASDMSNLAGESKRVIEAGADFLHLVKHSSRRQLEASLDDCTCVVNIL